MGTTSQTGTKKRTFTQVFKDDWRPDLVAFFGSRINPLRNRSNPAAVAQIKQDLGRKIRDIESILQRVEDIEALPIIQDFDLDLEDIIQRITQE